MTNEPPLDPEVIAALRSVADDGGAFFKELIGIFLQDTPPRLAEIRAGLAAGNLVTASRAAHSIKGSAGNFGATHLSHLAHEVEMQAKTGNSPELAGLMNQLEAEFRRVESALEALRSN